MKRNDIAAPEPLIAMTWILGAGCGRKWEMRRVYGFRLTGRKVICLNGRNPLLKKEILFCRSLLDGFEYMRLPRTLIGNAPDALTPQGDRMFMFRAVSADSSRSPE